jgi:hypothetical protein
VLLYFARLAAFTGCVCLGVFVKQADVRCGVEVVRVPFPVVAEQQDLPRDAEETAVPSDAG